MSGENQVEECTRELLNAILESREYRDFLKIKEKVSENPELRKKINAFRRHNFEVQNSAEVLDMYDEIDKMYKEYEEFRKNILVDEFLKRELRVCRMIQQVSVELISAVDLDIQEIAERISF